ncbi:MAG: hypothetical protein H6708_04440 [Kofleriaceae bacterium]|nr:hypothetical protein [Kofleriaceae bacterium]
MWRLTERGDRCELALDLGWPEARVVVGRDGAARCAVAVDRDVLTPLRPHRAPPPRVRLVGTAAGVAAADRAELVGDHAVVRVRPGAGALVLDGDVSGPQVAAELELADGVRVVAGDPAAVLTATPGASLRLFRPDGTRWRRVAIDPGGLPIVGTSVLVVGDGAARRTWLVRGPAVAGGVVAPLLADDAGRRRRYVLGGSLPVVGWRNPHDLDRSLGLDGWVSVAAAQGALATTPVATPAATALTWHDPGGGDRAYCGTLAPPPPTEPTCTAGADDGVTQCRVALDPELTARLHDLTELVALQPRAFTGTGVPSTGAAFVLLRGDTGEILAEGDFVPGRAGSAYAPATPALGRALERLREDRDPRTGEPVAPGAGGESSAEKFDRHRAIAIGSTLKPLVARAAELVAPRLTSSMWIGVGATPATCRRRHRAVSRLLGHCPPTELLGRLERGGVVDFHGYLARSSNGFQAALGVLALGWPDGRYVLDDDELARDALLAIDVAALDRPLEVLRGDRRVVGGRGVRLGPLRDAPLWRRLEAIVGRPLCTLGSKRACTADGDRRDLCAARALPIAAPTADLRHLVALGPSSFDMYAPGGGDARTVPVTEYFQLLRGSGVHPVGSLAQLADAFNRVVYDPTEDGAFQLAASWFPAPAVGRVPAACTRDAARTETVRGAGGGLCGALRPGGTAARALGDLLDDPRVRLFGAKTGTIDTLADLGEQRRRCDAWNRAHTVADRPARAADQPYWLDCGAATPDDSLLVVAFAVVDRDDVVPLTLALHLERSGKSVAALAARHYIDAIAAYLVPPPVASSPAAPASTTAPARTP